MNLNTAFINLRINSKTILTETELAKEVNIFTSSLSEIMNDIGSIRQIPFNSIALEKELNEGMLDHMIIDDDVTTITLFIDYDENSKNHKLLKENMNGAYSTVIDGLSVTVEFKSVMEKHPNGRRDLFFKVIISNNIVTEDYSLDPSNI